MSWKHLFRLAFLSLSVSQSIVYGMVDSTGSKADTSQLARPDSLRIFCYGYANFFALYTRMQETYSDYAYSHRNVTFAPYPDPGLVNRNAEQPFLFLATEMHKKDIVGRLNWYLVHSFTGMDANWSKNLLFRMPPSLEMVKYTRIGTFSITAGNCTGKTWMSTLTLSGQSLTNHPFDRLPWDWYPSPFDKYKTIYTERVNPLTVIGLNASQGFLFAANQLFKRIDFKLFFGRTNFTATPVQIAHQLPSYVTAVRCSYALHHHTLGFNSYYKYQLASHKANALQSSIYSVDYKGSFLKSFQVSAELATFSGTLHSAPSTAFVGEVGYTHPSNGLFFSLGASYIPYHFVSLDNAVLNSNVNHTISGHPNDQLYNLTLFANPLQTPDVLSNNRKGLFVRAGRNSGKWRFELEHAYNKEINHMHDSLTFFHTANAFTRSRFTPWLQGSGPNKRIGGRYRYTTETIPYSPQEQFHFFSALYRIKYKTNLLKKECIMLITPSYSSAFEKALSQPILSTWTLDLSSFFRATQRISLLAFVTVQNTRSTKLEPTKLAQQSWASGFGTDIEIGRNAGFYFRYKRFGHKDKNDHNDLFKGDEITTEIKIFF